MTTSYEVLAVRYGSRTGSRSEIYLNHHVYGEPDAPLGMDYYFWLVRGPDRTIVVDTGFGRTGGARRSRTTLVEPLTALRRLGVEPSAVGQVVVTHAHYDHIGNLAGFPNAEVLVTAEEFAFWTGPYGRREQFSCSVEPDEVAHLAALHQRGRLTLTAAAHTVAPGVEMLRVGGHTPGQAVLVVPTATGTAVLASDAAHYYEELERDRPFAFVADLPAMYRGFETLRELAAAPGAVLVPGHDPDVMRRFPAHDGAGPGLAVRIA